MRFFLLDKIKELVPGKFANGIKCWSLDNEIFQDHFPGFPTTPGVLLNESMAQLAGILIEHSYYKEFNTTSPVYPVLSIIHKAKFRTFVQPGDQCFIDAELITVDRGKASARVKTMVEDKLVCEAVLSFVIGTANDTKSNPYLSKRQQYYHTILPEKFKNVI